jgi:hypothetical protein
MDEWGISVNKIKDMRSLVYFGYVIVTAAIAASALAQSTDDSLTRYAVNINRTPQQSWPGYGIYLGGGLVITAAHVVGHVTEPKVLIAGQELPATVIKEGDFNSVDLTLLSVDQERLPVDLRRHRQALCLTPPKMGEDVTVVVPEGVSRSRILSPMLLPIEVRTKFPTVIRDVASTGNSGSGIFDTDKKCLLGIMSRKIWRGPVRKDNTIEELQDIAKYFVPASTIAEFIPPELHFNLPEVK